MFWSSVVMYCMLRVFEANGLLIPEGLYPLTFVIMILGFIFKACKFLISIAKINDSD